MINKFSLTYVFVKYKFLASSFYLKRHQMQYSFSLILVGHHPMQLPNLNNLEVHLKTSELENSSSNKIEKSANLSISNGKSEI